MIIKMVKNYRTEKLRYNIYKIYIFSGNKVLYKRHFFHVRVTFNFYEVFLYYRYLLYTLNFTLRIRSHYNSANG